MQILTIESTCDETAAAVVTDSLEILGSVVASQEDLHRKFRGVVPEIAARAHVERMLPVIDETLRRANISIGQLDAIAVANTPGLAGSLLVGLAAAKSLAWALNIPLIGINHLHAHIYACRLAAGRDVFPCLGLIVSGGHSHLYRCESPFQFDLMGGTIDDAAGEAFDKVASMLDLGFPGGPQVSRIARRGDPTKHRFPRPFLRDRERIAFSFSGLKTAVRYAISDPSQGPFNNDHLTEQQKADLAAGFEQAVVDCLVGKTLLAARRANLGLICVGGGVAANQVLRVQLSEAAATEQLDVIIAPPELCTDNAVMGAIAIEKLRSGFFDGLDLDVYPGLVR